MPGISEERVTQAGFLEELTQLAANLAGSPPPSPFGDALPAPPETSRAQNLESIAECEPPAGDGLFSLLKPECSSDYREQFRLLRTQLLLHRARFENQQDFRTVSVMSTEKGEGKSFTASNLAAVLAVATGQRVLLIDVDPESRPIPVGIPLAEGDGLPHALSAPGDWARATLHVKNTPLYVMGRGSAKGSRNLDLEKLPRLLQVLREQFEWIILDAGAFARCPEAPWLAAVTDGTLLVVQQSASSFGAVQESLSSIPPERLVGVVFNRRKHNSKLRLRVRIKVGRKTPRPASIQN